MLRRFSKSGAKSGAKAGAKAAEARPIPTASKKFPNAKLGPANNKLQRMSERDLSDVAAVASEPSSRQTDLKVRLQHYHTLSEIDERLGKWACYPRRGNRICAFIHPGQKLTIHTSSSGYAGSSGSSKSYTVKVRKGDTLWDIARAHGVSLRALRRANGLPSSGLIRPGDLVRIPKS